MKLQGFHRQSRRYMLIAFIFGLLLLAVTIPIAFFINEDIHEPILIGVICLAPIGLPWVARLAGKRQDELDRINRELEQTVRERTGSMQSLLDVSGQGFLSFGDDYLVGPEYSKACETIFGRGELAGEPIDELLYGDEESRANFRRGLNLFFNGTALAEVIFDLLDARIGIEGKMIGLQYRTIGAQRVMLSLVDVTEANGLRQAVERENELKDMLVKITVNRRAFAAFDRHMRALLEAVRGDDNKIADYVYDIHTLKGDAGFFGMKGTQEAAHELENYLSDSAALGEKIDPAPGLKKFREAFLGERGLLIKTFGREWLRGVETIEVPLREYARIESHVKTHYADDEYLVRALETQRLQPLSLLLARLPRLAQDLAGRMGKKLAPLKISGGDSPVFSDELEKLVESFSHIIRNMIDHGIESPAEREAAGKAPAGEIAIEIKESPGALTFTIRDDGRGLQFDEIEKTARRRGIIKNGHRPAPKELIALIFRENFTTAKNADLVSGRGVGLTAVRAAAKNANGNISVKTADGKGTEFIISVAVPRVAEKESAA